MKLADALAAAKAKQRERSYRGQREAARLKRNAERAARAAALAQLGPQIRVSAREAQRLAKMNREMQLDLCRLAYRIHHAPGRQQHRAPPLPSTKAAYPRLVSA